MDKSTITSVLFLLAVTMLATVSSENREIRLVVSSKPEKQQSLESHLLHKQSFSGKEARPVKVELLHVPMRQDSSHNHIRMPSNKFVEGKNAGALEHNQRPKAKKITKVCSCSCGSKAQEAFEEFHGGHMSQEASDESIDETMSQETFEESYGGPRSQEGFEESHGKPMIHDRSNSNGQHFFLANRY